MAQQIIQHHVTRASIESARLDFAEIICKLTELADVEPGDEFVDKFVNVNLCISTLKVLLSQHFKASGKEGFYLNVYTGIE